jgi:hypothetical protein
MTIDHDKISLATVDKALSFMRACFGMQDWDIALVATYTFFAPRHENEMAISEK